MTRNKAHGAIKNAGAVDAGALDRIMDSERVETPKELAARVGLNEGRIRYLIQTRQIEHVRIGSRVLIPVGAFARFLAAH